MRKLRCVPLALALLVLLAGAPALAEPIPEAYTSRTKVSVGFFATVSGLCLFDDFSSEAANARFEQTFERVKEILAEIDEAVSVSVPTSDLARFNAMPDGGTMAIRPLTAELISIAKRMYEQTLGYYDPSVFPLTDLWGFSPRFTYNDELTMPYDRPFENGTRAAPDGEYIEAFRRLVDFDGVVLAGDEATGYTLTKNIPPVEVAGRTYQAQIDLGGIAKGYAADRVSELLSELGYRYGYFSCGSSSVRLLKNASSSAKKAGSDDFRLQVRNPRPGESSPDDYAAVSVRDQSLSSSGDYDNNYFIDGARYAHIINPFTGYPLNLPARGAQRGICTVTLLSGSAVEDDALTTALCLMDLGRAIDFVNERLPDRDVVLVYYRADSPVYEVITNLPDGRLTLFDPAFVLAAETDGEGRIVYTGELYEP